ncbi:MAG: hypothetical protein COA85_06400 [Robiginitomaculum sp.]|nr:MAG: hypothetical protein COA85_06400 [Robiginitomaculum sp.]
MAEFFKQLWTRRVVQFGVLYLGVSWLVLQAAIAIEATAKLPDWIDQSVLVFLVLGFPLALLLAWAQDSKVKKDSGVDALLPARSTLGKPVLAVLPFSNFSSDQEQEHFADSLTEDLITALSKHDNLEVVARNSSFVFKGQSVDVRKAGAKLGADYVLEGSLRKANNVIRCTAQLIDAKTGHHLWAERDDRHVTDSLKAQDELSAAIVSGVRGALKDQVSDGANKPGNDENGSQDNARVLDPSKAMTFSDLIAPGTIKTRFAKSGSLNIAYKVSGEGPPDIVFAPGIISHQNIFGNMPPLRDSIAQLAKFSRIVTFDKRGQGLSDPTVKSPTLEERIDDIRAVMDDAGLKRAFLYGLSEGGPMCLLFAATYPERVQGLILMGTTARFSQSDDYPIGTPAKEIMKTASVWGRGVLRDVFFPSISREEMPDNVYRAMEKVIASPHNIKQLCEMLVDIDVRSVLPAIQVPTLVLHFSGDLAIPIRMGRYLAEHIPGAEFFEMAGSDHADLSTSPEAVKRVEQFCKGILKSENSTTDHGHGTILATVLAIKAGRSISDEAFGKTVQAYNGRPGGGADGARQAVFDGPTRAVHCAFDLMKLGEDQASIGLHTGLTEIRGSQITGDTIKVLTKLGDHLRPGEIVITGILHDLLVQTEIETTAYDQDISGFDRLYGVKGQQPASR